MLTEPSAAYVQAGACSHLMVGVVAQGRQQFRHGLRDEVPVKGVTMFRAMSGSILPLALR